jgi:hypothetical protein
MLPESNFIQFIPNVARKQQVRCPRVALGVSCIPSRQINCLPRTC